MTPPAPEPFIGSGRAQPGRVPPRPRLALRFPPLPAVSGPGMQWLSECKWPLSAAAQESVSRSPLGPSSFLSKRTAARALCLVRCSVGPELRLNFSSPSPQPLAPFRALWQPVTSRPPVRSLSMGAWSWGSHAAKAQRGESVSATGATSGVQESPAKLRPRPSTLPKPARSTPVRRGGDNSAPPELHLARAAKARGGGGTRLRPWP